MRDWTEGKHESWRIFSLAQVFQAKVKFCLLVLAIWVPMSICGEEMNVFPWGFYAQDADSHTIIWQVRSLPMCLGNREVWSGAIICHPQTGRGAASNQRNGLPKFRNHLTASKMQGLSVPIGLSFDFIFDIFCWFFIMRLGNSGKFCLSSVNSTNFAIILEIFAKILISQIWRRKPLLRAHLSSMSECIFLHNMLARCWP